MTRHRTKKTNVSPDGIIMTEKHGEWKKGDDVWYKNFHGEWKYGKIMYFSENPDNGKTWVTYWNLTNPRYESSYLEGMSREPPTKSLRDKVLKKIARSNIKNKKDK